MPQTDQEIAERAGRFLNWYRDEAYPLFRKGARYHKRRGEALEFMEVEKLCRTWDDDERLRKLAVIFLTTDHRFAESGTRSIAQFASMASWADGRLAEAEARL